MERNRIGISACLLALGLVGCGDDEGEGSGTLSVILESESSITEGLDPGDKVENIQDGWQVRYDRFIVAVGEIEVYLATDENVRSQDEELFVVDLTSVPSSGLPLWEIPDLRAGRWEFGYSTPGAGHGATRDDSVSQSDFERMQDTDATYLISGTLTKSDGQSCPPPNLVTPGSATPSGSSDAGQDCYDNTSIAFEFFAKAETVFSHCALDGIPGFSIAGGSTQTVAATIHGDHPFFNGFPEGDEGGVMRLAQWLADCDLDLDGEVTEQELKSIAPADLAEMDPVRYQLGGSPIKPLDNMWTYLSAQLKTQGHMDGEGECEFDGLGHED